MHKDLIRSAICALHLLFRLENESTESGVNEFEEDDKQTIIDLHDALKANGEDMSRFSTRYYNLIESLDKNDE